MGSVLKAISKFVIIGFSIVIIGMMFTFTYGALNRIFSGNIVYVMFGLTLFDIATLCWGITFIYQSKGVTQYAVAAMGFTVGLLGTLGMIGAEVMLTGMTPEQIAMSSIPMYMRYGFLIVVAIHVILVYIHHGSSPEISEQINIGVAVGSVTDRAQKKATQQMTIMEDQLAGAIMGRILDDAMRNLTELNGRQVVFPGLPGPQQIIDVPATPVTPHFTTTCLICGKPTQGTAYCGPEHWRMLMDQTRAPSPTPEPKVEPSPAQPPFDPSA
jgi:hypothetical protein